MRRLIRLTESQLHNLIVEALLESARESDWRFPYFEAQKILFQLKNVESADEEQKLWIRYCDMIEDAQERFKERYHAQYDYEIEGLSDEMKNFIKDKYKRPSDCYDKSIDFLFRPLLYLSDYEEMRNENPNYKYLNFVLIGGINAFAKQETFLVEAILPVEQNPEKEWDISNYMIVSQPNSHLGGKRQNRSDRRKNCYRTMGTPNSPDSKIEIDDMGRMNAFIDYGENENDDVWVDRNSEGYDKKRDSKRAKDFWTKNFDEKFWKSVNGTSISKNDTDNDYHRLGSWSPFAKVR